MNEWPVFGDRLPHVNFDSLIAGYDAGFPDALNSCYVWSVAEAEYDVQAASREELIPE